MKCANHENVHGLNDKIPLKYGLILFAPHESSKDLSRPSHLQRVIDCCVDQLHVSTVRLMLIVEGCNEDTFAEHERVGDMPKRRKIDVGFPFFDQTGKLTVKSCVFRLR